MRRHSKAVLDLKARVFVDKTVLLKPDKTVVIVYVKEFHKSLPLNDAIKALSHFASRNTLQARITSKANAFDFIIKGFSDILHTFLSTLFYYTIQPITFQPKMKILRSKINLTFSLFTITYYLAKNPAKLVKSEE